MAEYARYACVFLFGIIAGSFVNVCVYRIPRDISIVRPRSRCPSCGAAIKPRELIPIVSFIFLRGKCSSCRAAISARYPIIEIICGILSAALLNRFGLSFRFACYAILCLILTAVFFIDLEWMRIPNALVISALIPACAAWAEFMFFLTPPERFRSVYASVNGAAPLLGLIPCAAFLLIYTVSLLAGKSGNAIGLGDVKLLIPTGLALGLRQIALAVFISIIMGGVAGAALLITRVKNRKDPIPFGPFIVVGVIAAIFMQTTLFI